MSSAVREAPVSSISSESSLLSVARSDSSFSEKTPYSTFTHEYMTNQVRCNIAQNTERTVSN